MTQKPEPWWPLKWKNHPFGDGIKHAIVRDHPTVRKIARLTVEGHTQRQILPDISVGSVFFHDEHSETLYDTSNLGIRIMLLELAYPEGNNDTET